MNEPHNVSFVNVNTDNDINTKLIAVLNKWFLAYCFRVLFRLCANEC